MSVIFEKNLRVMARNLDDRGTTIETEFTAFYAALGGIPSISINMTDETFAYICKYMKHGDLDRRRLSPEGHRSNVNDNLHLVPSNTLHELAGDGTGLCVTRFVARNRFSKQKCEREGGEALVKLFALADVRGFTKRQKAKSYHDNLQHCPFNNAMRRLFGEVLAQAVVLCCMEHGAYGAYLDRLEGVPTDEPALVSTVVRAA